MDRLRCSLLVLALASSLTGCPDDGTPMGEGTGTGSSGSSGSSPGSSTTSLTMTQTSTPSTSLEPSSSSTEDPDSGTTDAEVCIQGTWTGVFTYGFETTTFTPCEGEPRGSWWYEGPIDACGTALVTVTGTVCGPGNYGHLGGYSYQFGGSVEGDPCLPAQCDVASLECAPFPVLCDIAECSLDEQDCGGANKCVPASADGLPPWTETECVPVGREPLEVGQPCTIDPPNDDCESGAWCIPDAPGSGTGTCARLCSAENSCGMFGDCVGCNAALLVAFGVCAPESCMGEPGCPGEC
jgi:hypothetical protein